MTVFGHAVLFSCPMKRQRLCVGEDSDAVDFIDVNDFPDCWRRKNITVEVEGQGKGSGGRDVAGRTEEREDLTAFVDFLRNRQIGSENDHGTDQNIDFTSKNRSARRSHSAVFSSCGRPHDCRISSDSFGLVIVGIIVFVATLLFSCHRV